MCCQKKKKKNSPTSTCDNIYSPFLATSAHPTSLHWMKENLKKKHFVLNDLFCQRTLTTRTLKLRIFWQKCHWYWQTDRFLCPPLSLIGMNEEIRDLLKCNKSFNVIGYHRQQEKNLLSLPLVSVKKWRIKNTWKYTIT